MSRKPTAVLVRNTRPEDFAEVIEVCRLVYPDSPPWTAEQLQSHLNVFPEGQFVAVETESGRILGMAASLIVLWSDYEMQDNWRDFTDHGMFTNHDPSGHTLYGAEVLVRPSLQRRGVGSKIYAARFDLARRLGLWRIRAAARLRGYHRYAAKLSAEQYVAKILAGEVKDPTLSFQMQNGFRVLAVVGDYLRHDPESLGHAALIEWLNPDIPESVRAAGGPPPPKPGPTIPPGPASPTRRPGAES